MSWFAPIDINNRQRQYCGLLLGKRKFWIKPKEINEREAGKCHGLLQ